MQNSNLLKKFPLIVAAFMIILFVAGCGIGGNELPDLTNRVSVVYDGNGGFLGNKTFTSRKLFVNPGSKIPKYLQEYAEKGDPYVVPSLGLASRYGYTLYGWYCEQDASYQLDEFGIFIKLDTADGNGVYNLDDEGQYVTKYNLDDNGEYIYINIEDAPQNASPSTPYVYFKGTDGSFGFQIYDEDDVNHKEAYENEENQFTLKEIQDNIGVTGTYYVYEYLEETFKMIRDKDPETEEVVNKFDKVLVDFDRYNRLMAPYTEEDEGLDRYNLETGYVEIEAMMELRANGTYVNYNNQYVVYDDTNVEHQGLARYQISDRYVFIPTPVIDTPSKMERYAVSITYWDFEKDVVNEDVILKAHWVKKLTVVYTWINSKGNTESASMTEKANPYDISKTVPLSYGGTVGKKSADPVREGYTFIGWSKVEGKYDPWDFKNDVFPEGTDTLTLYAYMIEGNYTTISDAAGLAKVVNNPEGKYVLVNDIDLKGKALTNESPLGFKYNKQNQMPIFTGEFLGLDFKIYNYSITINNKKGLFDAEKFIGLFPTVQGAKIERLKVENCTLIIDNTIENNDLGISTLIGEILEGDSKTQIIDVSVSATYQVKDNSESIDCIVYVGDVVAKGFEFAEIDSLTNADIQISGIEALVTEGNYRLQLLNRP